MARPSKAAKAAAEASKIAENPPARVIDPVAFVRVRDSVYARLQTIQDLIKSFSNDYLRQTNLLLGEATNIEGDANLEQIQNVFSGVLPALQAAPVAPVEEKKERKKRTHDPNAPKRPLTPYFLYMQTARPIIASDLGAEARKGAVQEEGQRRWSIMEKTEKSGWNNAYRYNLRLYNARVHSYKSGNAEAKNMSDEEARVYADSNEIPLPPSGEDGGADDQAIAEQLQQGPADEAPEEPATKTPKKAKTAAKRKTGTPAAEPEAPKAAATPASPEKKRKRTSKAAELAEEPKKSGRKKAKSG
jgi:hypothetical protein